MTEHYLDTVGCCFQDTCAIKHLGHFLNGLHQWCTDRKVNPWPEGVGGPPPGLQQWP